MSSRIRTVLAIVLAALVAVPAGAAAADPAPRTRTRTCRCQSAWPTSSSRMTLEEKVGQMTQTERYQVVRRRRPRSRPGELGSILSGGGSTPRRTRRGWADMSTASSAPRWRPACTSRCCTASTPCTATATCSARPCSPQHRPRRHARPGARSEVAHITAEETRAIGPQWTFAPCICAARDDRWGRTYESFSEDPDLVTRWRPRSTASRARAATRRTATACSPRRSTTRATATPVRHRQRRLHDRPGHRDHQPQRLLGRRAAPVRAGRAEAPRGQRDAVVLERRLDRGRRRQPRSRCTRTASSSPTC